MNMPRPCHSGKWCCSADELECLFELLMQEKTFALVIGHGAIFDK
jgi:hypothetical protein